MAEKQPIIVVKKITIQAAGAHGGSWKVAFADFMTALMSFFLVMWLVSQSEPVKKNISDYFSTPSVIEYNFSNYGVELTLEKLFLDIINEPLKFFQAFITPTDFTPNILGMGSKKIVLHHLADQLGDLAQNVEVNEDEIVFDISADQLFEYGTSKPAANYVGIMEKLKTIISGLEDSNVYIDGLIFDKTVSDGSRATARNVAEARVDLISGQVQSSLEHPSVDVYGKSEVREAKGIQPGQKPSNGEIKFRMKQKDLTQDGRKPRELDEVFGKSKEEGSVYNNFVKQLVENKKASPAKETRKRAQKKSL